jgi:hypothetical protein
MAVDREQWQEKFQELPHWECPTCLKGHLLPLKDKVWFEETGSSTAAHDHDAWEPDWIFNRFSGFLQCNMPACAEVVTISGDSPSDFYEYQDEYEHIQELKNLFVVKAINPTPIPIHLPATVPEVIADAVGVAATLTWSSAEAAGNQIRQAVELFMDDVGIPATTASGARITLHNRIDKFAKTDKENGEVLLATKWLGNSGSHPGGLVRDDVLDAFDMLEYVLENRYGTTKKDLMAKVAAINAQKGPVKKAP